MKSPACLIRSAFGAVAFLSCAPGRANSALGPVLAQVSVDSGGGKSYVVEILMTLVLFGLALWVICKSSRRV